jgi:hypothetical protein
MVGATHGGLTRLLAERFGGGVKTSVLRTRDFGTTSPSAGFDGSGSLEASPSVSVAVGDQDLQMRTAVAAR